MLDKTKEIPLGWLAPDGSFFKCQYYEHVATAEEICELLGIDRFDIYEPVDDFLIDRGFVKISQSSIGSKHYIIYWSKHLTSVQRYYLNDYFEKEQELKFPINPTSICRWKYEEDMIKE